MIKQRGFTLVELLVVFAIGALIIGIAPVALQSLRESTEYRDALRLLISDMRQARWRATSEGREMRFSVDLKQRIYGIEGGSQHPLAQALTLRATVADQELQANSVASIRFLPSGGASGGSFDLLRASGTGVRVRVDWLTGRVEQEPLVP
ncbi:GspH/FimT family pseudopilin [Xylophilus sp. Leaf220]|uniref:GspH/FimT family pseudopilin n=1 Tax=Xylophilus sp. Leaf220 TaxID=1735686 RepID=UPI0009E86E52|nr:GspH/FimT family pseudopilin [Xylophilus sp. Leaf220]